MKRIVFGTDGWRGVIAQDFTFDNVKVVAQAIADYMKVKGLDQKGLIVGYDTRFLSDMFARSLAEVAASNDIPVFLASKPAPTPMISFTVKNRSAGGGVVITASHNPPIYSGIKFKPEYGGSALTQITKEIESFLYRNPVKYDEEKAKRYVREEDFEVDYLDRIKSLVGLQLIGEAGFKIVVDAMHGAGDRIIDRLLSATKSRLKNIRFRPDPTFGGVKPEPIPQNLQPLIDTVVEGGADIGLATDGDADRFGVITSKGEFVSPHEAFALLILHLHQNKGWRGGVVKTASVCNIVSKVAEKLGLPVYETAVGFKNICELMLKEDILIGGEESGGAGFKNHVPDRDGILASLFILEMMAMEKNSIDEILEELKDEFGEVYYDRIDLPYDKPNRMKLVPILKSNPPRQVCGLKVERVSTYRGVEVFNGIKFHFADQRSWLLIRASETEPIMRIYAEATSDDMIQRLLREGHRLLKRVAKD
ncbi:MAG: phosphoglucomutase/phosphomannomutase family protein [Candidatus Bathyarchaeota archaeon]|nr:phosphoglucomutase/phosphomannomutase family protein [Candidatus Bathyarchaeota archaeon]MDH5713251.1 phosphoglucomutase/phosphomannomutase family protein [Candidatus Bathyarchaeota archaeon]